MIWIWNEVYIIMVREDINTSGFDDRHIEFGCRSKFVVIARMWAYDSALEWSLHSYAKCRY